MRTCIVLACLAAAACGDSDSDAYTIGQVAHGYGYGVVTGIDYGHGLVSGYGAIGNRGYAGYGGYGGYAGHLGYGYGGYSGHHYGKRSSDSDSDSDAYTFGQIAHGLPVHNAYATGHPHNVGVITGVDYGHGRVSGYGAIGNQGYAGYGGYGGYGGSGHHYGKRSADSDSDSDAYTFGQIAHGLPVHNAYATGHLHNVGVITGVDYGYGRVSGYGAIGNRGYAGYAGYGGYGGYGHHYGKRSADSNSDSDAYTFGQIAHGLPIHNAYATGHPHNVGVITGVDYGYGRVSGYGAIGNRGYAGYAGHGGYSGYGGYGHHYGKRSADSDADSKAYTIAQVAHGLPVHNAYATGHPHNVGVVTRVSHGYGYGGYSGYGGYAGYGGYSGYGGNAGYGHGYAGLGYGYGK